MANAYKVLGQSAPGAGSNTDVYTVPATTEAVISTVIIANRGASAGTFRLAVRPNGAAIANQHYIAYDVAIGANDSTTMTLGLTLDAADVVTAYCSSADMSVNIFGTEITA
jgi:hypothetical protein